MLRIELFGGPIVRYDQTVVELTPLAGAVLALFALNLHRKLYREEVIAEFWPDDDPDVGRHKLRQALHSIRRSLQQAGCEPDSVLRCTRTTVSLEPATVSTDVAEFEDAVAAAKAAANIEARLHYLSRATDLYRADPLPGLYQESLVAACNRLAAVHLDLLHDLVTACEQAGDLDRAVSVARQVVAADPLVEEAHRNLMRLHVARGQPTSALYQYKEFERILADELNETPSPETRELAAAIRQAAHPGGAPPPMLAGSKTAKQPPTVAGAVHTRDRRSHARVARIVAAVVVGLAALGFALTRGHSRVSTRAQSPSPSLPIASKLPPDRNTELWVRQYAPAPDEKGTEPFAITTDMAGNIYVAGLAETIHNDADFLTIKFDRDGKQIWARRYDGPHSDVDRARCIAVDVDGNVYVSGESDNGKGNDATRLSGVDIATIKYGPDGKRSTTWPDVGFGVGVRRYNGPDNGEDWPLQIALSEAGDLYVLGKSWERGAKGSENGFRAILLKYDKTGRETRLWRCSRVLENDPAAHPRMSLSRYHKIFVALTSNAESPSGSETDVNTFDLDMAGRELWSKTFGANNQTNDSLVSMGTDEGDNVYIACRARGMPGTLDQDRICAVTVSYDATGRRRWSRGTLTEADRISEPGGAKVWTSGCSLVVGQGKDPQGDRVSRAVYRDSTGAILWTSDYTHDDGCLSPPHIAGFGDLMFSCKRCTDTIESFRYLNDNHRICWVHGFRAADMGEIAGVTVLPAPFTFVIACQAALTPKTPRHITLIAYTP